MIKLDDDLLAELGLAGLPPEEKKKLLAHIYETLEMRVGMKLAERMTDAQLTEFEQFIDRNDEAGALHWLETNFPNYKDVVSAEFDVLKQEIARVAPQILAAGTNPPAAVGAVPMQAMPQPMAPYPTYQQPQYPPQPAQYMPPAGVPAMPPAPVAPFQPMPQAPTYAAAPMPPVQQPMVPPPSPMPTVVPDPQSGAVEPMSQNPIVSPPQVQPFVQPPSTGVAQASDTSSATQDAYTSQPQ